MLPLRLYLSVSVALMLVMRVVAALAPGSHLVNADGLDLRKNPIDINVGPMTAAVRDGRVECAHLPAWVCRSLDEQINVDAATLQREI